MIDFNLTNQFGFACVDEGLKPPPMPTHHTHRQETLNPGSYHTAEVKNDDDQYWRPLSDP